MSERELEVDELLRDFQRACETVIWQGDKVLPSITAHRALLRNELRKQLLDASTLTARAVRAEADAKRVDALEAWTKGDQMLCPPGNHGGSEDHWLLSREDEARGTRYGQWCDEYEGATLREAIDKAIARPATP